jgi:hypothetical protein
VQSVFKTHIDVIHFRKTSTSRLTRDKEADQIACVALSPSRCHALPFTISCFYHWLPHPSLQLTLSRDPEVEAAMVEKLTALSQQPDIYERLVRALGK